MSSRHVPAVRDRDDDKVKSITRYTIIPVAFGIAYLALTLDPGYVAFLDDESRFLEAIHNRTLAFFPGYIGFLRSATLLMNVLTPAASLQAISAFFGSLTVAFFWLWLRQLRIGGLVGVLGVLTFATSVYHLYNSSVGTTYTVEAWAFLAVGYFCVKAERKPHMLYAAAVILAISGLFRQTTPVFLIPLFACACWRGRNYRPIGVAAVLSLVWLVPTVGHFGGLTSTVSAGTEQVKDAVLPSTVFSGMRGAAVNCVRFLVYLFYGVHLLLLLALKRIRAFELLWIGPAIVFYAMFYVSWPGYVLGIVAVLYLLGVWTTAQLPRVAAVTILSAGCLINFVQFFLSQPVRSPQNTAMAIASTYAFQYSREGIRQRYQVRLRDLVNRIDTSAAPATQINDDAGAP